MEEFLLIFEKNPFAVIINTLFTCFFQRKKESLAVQYSIYRTLLLCNFVRKLRANFLNPTCDIGYVKLLKTRLLGDEIRNAFAFVL